jgi:hypothetical protein
MMAITTSSSISVKPRPRELFTPVDRWDIRRSLLLGQRKSMGGNRCLDS